MNKFIIASTFLLLASPAFAQSIAEKTGVNSLLGMSPSTPDFVKEAAISGMFEVQSSQLAEQRGTSMDKSFAQEMITDHTKANDQLKSLVQSANLNVPVPTALDSAHQGMLDKLNGLQGADFQKQYRDDQVSGHKDAVSLFQRYADGGDNTALKDWAGKTLPTLQHHLQMAQNLTE